MQAAAASVGRHRHSGRVAHAARGVCLLYCSHLFRNQPNTKEKQNSLDMERQGHANAIFIRITPNRV